MPRAMSKPIVTYPDAVRVVETYPDGRAYVTDHTRALSDGRYVGYVVQYERPIGPDMPRTAHLTPASLNLFLSLANDASNWGGTPLVEVNDSEKGNLTDLKVKGLLTTVDDGGDVFADFTDAGIALAAEHGIDLADEG